MVEFRFPLADDVHGVLQCRSVVTELVGIVGILLLAEFEQRVSGAGW
jgi:hypothetical protein